MCRARSILPPAARFTPAAGLRSNAAGSNVRRWQTSAAATRWRACSTRGQVARRDVPSVAGQTRAAYFGGRNPGEASHSSIREAVSAWRALRSNKSRSLPSGIDVARARVSSASRASRCCNEVVCSDPFRMTISLHLYPTSERNDRPSARRSKIKPAPWRSNGASQQFAVLPGTKSRVMRSDTDSRRADTSAAANSPFPPTKFRLPSSRYPRPPADRQSALSFGQNWLLVRSTSVASCHLPAQEPATCTETPAPRQHRRR